MQVNRSRRIWQSMRRTTSSVGRWRHRLHSSSRQGMTQPGYSCSSMMCYGHFKRRFFMLLPTSCQMTTLIVAAHVFPVLLWILILIFTDDFFDLGNMSHHLLAIKHARKSHNEKNVRFWFTTFVTHTCDSSWDSWLFSLVLSVALFYQFSRSYICHWLSFCGKRLYILISFREKQNWSRSLWAHNPSQIHL